MLNFKSGSFSDLANTPMGADLWALMTAPESLIRLETATYLGRPAVEGLQPQLLAAFGEVIRQDRWKQVTGAMARQVMEYLGYQFVRSGVKIKVKDLFSTGATYVKRNTPAANGDELNA
ncbi:hypothetical protein LJR129_005094 [Acidovorax sp. LjRoot129]|uniref:hypothetical protein n=1 Tax=unclassified Acidovorax TaxID=2684926 RepID=UPI003ECF67E5